MNTQITIPTFSGALPDHIRESARAYVDASKSDNTKLAYSKAWAAYQAFCVKHGHQLGDKGAVLHYLTALADAGIKTSTIKLHKSAISFMFGGSTGADNPTLTAEIRTLVQGITRTKAKAGEVAEQARPILLSELRQMVAACGETIGGRRDRAILLIGWFAALRRSEIASLNVSSLAFRDDALVVTLGQTKTDQAGQGYKIVLPVLKDQTIDPSSAVRAWLSASGISEGPLFVRVDRWGHAGCARIDDEHVDNLVKRLAKAAQLAESDYRRISAHGLRAGFATEAARRGLATSQIRQITRHKSDAMLGRYVREGASEITKSIRLVAGE